MVTNKTSDNKSRSPRGQPRNRPRALHETFQRRPQPEEETSAANPEPQRQLQTNGGTT